MKIRRPSIEDINNGTRRCGSCKNIFPDPVLGGSDLFIGPKRIKCSKCNRGNIMNQDFYRNLSLKKKLIFFFRSLAKHFFYIFLGLFMSIGPLLIADDLFSHPDDKRFFTLGFAAIGIYIIYNSSLFLMGLNRYISTLEKTYNDNGGFLWDYEYFSLGYGEDYLRNPLSKKQIYPFCFILWTLTFALSTPVSDYQYNVLLGDINHFGKIPVDSLLNGIVSGLFVGGIVLGIAYFINYLCSQFISSSKITAPKIFFVITILFTAYWLNFWYGRFIDVINYDKENIENTREKIEEYKNYYY